MAKRGGDTAKDELPKAKLTLSNLKKSLRLFSYVKKQKWQFVVALLFLAGTAAVGLIFPLVSGKMFSFFGENNLTPEQAKHDLQQTGLKLLILLVIQSFVSFGRVAMFTRVTENILIGLRGDLFKKLARMPMEFFAKNQVAELSSRISTDINVISEAFTVSVAEFIRQAVVGIGGLCFLVSYTKLEVALWFLVIMPPIIIIAIAFGKKIRKYSKTLQEKIAASNVIVGESLSGISNVKTFTNENFEINRYHKIITEIRDFARKYGIFRGSFFAFIMVFMFGAIFFLLYKMLELKIGGELSAEQFGTSMMLALFIAGSLGGLPEQIASIQRALGATDRVFEIIDEKNEEIDLDYVLPENQDRRGEIEFKNINFHYPTRPDFKVLKSVSFKAETGQTIALVGPSGSGKSTIAGLILRFYDPVSGEIKLNGISTKEMSLTELRSKMAIVPQDVILFAGSIKENILYGRPNATLEEVREAARKANALEFIDSFPEKFDTIVGERGIQLSGGQRQRIAIARAVLKDPAILILDEATSSLDSASERIVQEALDKLMEGRTSIVIAHRLSTIRNADRIIVLEKGEVVESGTHSELIQLDDGLYRSLCRLQFDMVSK
ncbi:MAG: ABC transporter transmembrane domain-containing protein [Bacteroidota bacterium]|nr:ABC transporter transmembrane domain-containing protein [Bacteroidota bacterium]